MSNDRPYLFCRETALDLQMVMGALYATCLFLGVNNAASVQPMISIERTVFYRERGSGMYSPFPYAAAQVVFPFCYLVFPVLSKQCITLNIVSNYRVL